MGNPSYLFYVQYCVYINPILLIYPFPSHGSPFGTHKFDFLNLFLSALAISSSESFLLDSTYK